MAIKYINFIDILLCKIIRAVHLSAALTHLHCLVHPFLQPQRISSWHASDASEIVV